MALDPQTHRIYLPTADFQPRLAISGCFAGAADHDPEHDEAARLRSVANRSAVAVRLTRAAIFDAARFSHRDCLLAQGGPPMITDDPGTPGNGHWENNLAIAFEHRPNEWSIDAPAIDLNYGWGDHIQLTLQGRRSRS